MTRAEAYKMIDHLNDLKPYAQKMDGKGHYNAIVQIVRAIRKKFRKSSKFKKIMVREVIELTCDCCGAAQYSSEKGTGLRTFVKQSISWGWKEIDLGLLGLFHVCSEECYEKFKKDKHLKS